ncbi:MAG: hypothetical protein ACI376_01035 [Candidatus Bruticola sp.]
MFQAVEELINSVSQQLEEPQIKRLRENKRHGGKVILPPGFEHLAQREHHYFLWPCLLGNIKGRRFALETIPCGTGGQCLIVLEFRCPMNLSFSLLDKEFAIADDLGLVGSRLASLSLLEEWPNLQAFSVEPDAAERFIADQETGKHISRLLPFLRLTANKHFLRLTRKNRCPEDLQWNHWSNILASFTSLADCLTD